jgi:Tfp pilus assembly protein PilN
MKRLNLLPPELRPREGGRRGSSYLVIGGLLASVVAMLTYAIVMGGVHSDETELASLKSETQQAQARADALRPYGEFAAMKDQRERSVRTVADTRFNYERLTRELARILPEGVWVGHLDVAPAPPAQDVVEAGADSVEGSQATPPAMTVSGCAPNQDVVADTLDRLRALTGATNVELGSSSHSSSDAVSSSSSSRKPYLVSSSSSGEGCDRSGRPRVAFDATVTLTSPVTGQLVEPTTVPAAATTTGGGS